jgi:hypothetical protein
VSNPTWSTVDETAIFTLACGMQAASCGEDGVRLSRVTAEACAAWPAACLCGAVPATALVVVRAATATAATVPIRVLRCI